jgi:hypothetical protein
MEITMSEEPVQQPHQESDMVSTGVSKPTDPGECGDPFQTGDAAEPPLTAPDTGVRLKGMDFPKSREPVRFWDFFPRHEIGIFIIFIGYGGFFVGRTMTPFIALMCPVMYGVLWLAVILFEPGHRFLSFLGFLIFEASIALLCWKLGFNHEYARHLHIWFPRWF